MVISRKSVIIADGGIIVACVKTSNVSPHGPPLPPIADNGRLKWPAVDDINIIRCQLPEVSRYI